MKKSRKNRPLPEVNIEFAAHGDAMTPGNVRALFYNPIYAGIGPFPALVDDETRVRSAARLIREEGAEQFLVNLLYVLRRSRETLDPDGT